MNYAQAIKLLTSQEKFYINPGLERIGKILALLGNPQDKIKIIHIAGTNGKGSVCAILANILKCSGYKTGLYTSPHLVEYTERIKINNKNILKKDFAKYIENICSIADKNNINLTEFEILTACAFKYFFDNKTDIAIIETGLGGRFDATNISKHPVLSIITSISLDHTDRLGNSIDEIAFEKAGIIKKNSTVIVSSKNKGINVIRKTAENKNAKLITVNKDSEIIFKDNKNILITDKKEYEFSLLGLYQKQNTALVLKACDYLKSLNYKIDLKKGLKSIKWDARLEYIKEKNILIDGAHNPDGALELKKNLDFYFPHKKKIFIYSTINTKDYKKITQILFNKDDEIFFLEFNHKNAVKFEQYINKVTNLNNIKRITAKDLPNILKRKELKVITGSLYMIGSIYKAIKN